MRSWTVSRRCGPRTVSPMRSSDRVAPMRVLGPCRRCGPRTSNEASLVAESPSSPTTGARKRRKATRNREWPFEKKPRQRPTLPQSLPCSTIGPGGLYFRVRDGNGCDPSGIAARKLEARKHRCGESLHPSLGQTNNAQQRWPPPCESRDFESRRIEKKGGQASRPISTG
jgi:hypothetical protein